MFVAHNKQRFENSQPFPPTLEIDLNVFILRKNICVSLPSEQPVVSWGQIDGCFYTQLIPKIILHNKFPIRS